MRKLLLLLALTAALLAALAAVVVTQPVSHQSTQNVVQAPSGVSLAARADYISLGFAFAAGVLATWIVRIPWAVLSHARLRWRLTWRRHVTLAGLAMIALGVLVFY
jgi:hypothetical protein